ncbi:hypothetical protein, partial [Mesorhizobium sp. M4A.F.Ca.ET.022.05.2.1]|uniref:hypothetical protein n=1 Tax=Mesorhizobium sp. M4A.F.Ca.ET.022.05.2.1 TaxID=2496653 RepID=UPI001AECB099
PIADQTAPQHNSNPSTPGHGRVGSHKRTACLKSEVSTSRGRISNNVTTPFGVLRSISLATKPDR